MGFRFRRVAQGKPPQRKRRAAYSVSGWRQSGKKCEPKPGSRVAIGEETRRRTSRNRRSGWRLHRADRRCRNCDSDRQSGKCHPALRSVSSCHMAFVGLSSRAKGGRDKMGKHEVARRAVFLDRDGVLNRPVVRNGDRKSTRLNSSHSSISYAVFCLKKKNKK